MIASWFAVAPVPDCPGALGRVKGPLRRCAPLTRPAPFPMLLQLPERRQEWFDSGLAHQTFIPTVNRPPVAEGRCGYAGSHKAISVERDSVGKEQLLEPLPLLE